MSIIFLECGTTISSPFNTGIQRVVRNIMNESQKVENELGHQCVLVRFLESNFHVIENHKIMIPYGPAKKVAHLLIHYANAIDKILTNLIPKKIYRVVRERVSPFIRRLHRKNSEGRLGREIKTVLAEQTDFPSCSVSTSPPVLLLLDSTWDLNMWSAVKAFRDSGGWVCAVLYDLIPFTHPLTVQTHTRNSHTLWWKEAPLHLDSVMCISQSVRAEFLKWQDKEQLAHRLTPDQVGYFYLGSELNSFTNYPQWIQIVLKKEPFYLVVGSIEPRKNHALILDAFEHLWRNGKTPSLVIVGGHGWKSETFLNRLQNHPLYNKNLFLLQHTTDAELALLYNNTSALIIASLAEGFGLPIVEAFQYGAKVICSNIPVFREIAIDRAVFFDVNSSRELADRVNENLCLNTPSSIFNKTLGSEWLTWRESTSQLFTRLFTCIDLHK